MSRLVEPDAENVYVDPTAQVAPSARLGRGTKVWAFTRIAEGAAIGEWCQLGQNVYVDRDVQIGSRVKIQNNVSVYTGVTIGDGVFLGPSCVFTNVTFPRAFIERKHELTATIVRRGVTIGANATIVCGVTLADFSFVASAALVTRDVEPFALVVGSPARRVGWACACGERLRDNSDGRGESVRCSRCQFAYTVRNDACEPLDARELERWWVACVAGPMRDQVPGA